MKNNIAIFFLLFLCLSFIQCVPEYDLLARENVFDPESINSIFVVSGHSEVDSRDGFKDVAINYTFVPDNLTASQLAAAEWAMVYKNEEIRYFNILLDRTQIVELNLPCGSQVCYQFSIRNKDEEESPKTMPYCFTP